MAIGLELLETVPWFQAMSKAGGGRVGWGTTLGWELQDSTFWPSVFFPGARPELELPPSAVAGWSLHLAFQDVRTERRFLLVLKLFINCNVVITSNKINNNSLIFPKVNPYSKFPIFVKTCLFSVGLF